MSVNGVAFYACACLVVLSSGATVWLRPLRHTIIAAAGFAVSLGLLLVATGADLLALLSVAVLLGGLGIGVVTARRGAFGPDVAVLPLGRWVIAAVVAGLGLIVLDGAALAGADGWHQGGIASASLVTLIHYRAPITAGLLLVLGGADVLVTTVIGRVSHDEHEWDRRRRARLEREERMRRRRQDRAAARQQRSAVRPEGRG
jgi:hypothetical protein